MKKHEKKKKEQISSKKNYTISFVIQANTKRKKNQLLRILYKNLMYSTNCGVKIDRSAAISPTAVAVAIFQIR